MSRYLGILGFVGIETCDGRTVPNFSSRDLPIPVYELGDGDVYETDVLGKLTEVWEDDFGRIWAWADLSCDDKLITGGMDMQVGDEDNYQLMAFTVYKGENADFATPAWNGVHLLRIDE